MINGIIVVRKEMEFTSHDVVAKLRGICKQKKIGHTGTLDPNATGVLPVCLGNATKLCDLFTDHDKQYIATFRLGYTSDTQDIWGEVQETKTELPTRDMVLSVISSFVGDSMQLPPMYSAKKINGKKLYELAREGKVVERKPCPIHIDKIEILSMLLPEVQIKVDCSKGTYIRTLCADIGEKCGCGAVMTGLQRTRVGQFALEQAFSLDELQVLSNESRIYEAVLPTESFFENLPVSVILEKHLKFLKNGNALKLNMFREELQMQKNERIRVRDEQGLFYGIYEMTTDGVVKPWKLFLPDGQE